jgi:hypothetical protein
MPAPTITEKSYKSLYPTGEIAWRGMRAGTMREISDGLSIEAGRNRENGKAIITDFFPYLTTLQKEWEETFRLPSGELLTQEQRKNRLIEAWMKTDVASFDGMNEMYLLSGINVVARPLEPGEDPRVIADSDIDVKVWDSVTGLNTVTGPNTRTGAFTIIPGTAETTIFADGRPGSVAKNYITVCGVSRTGQLSTSSRCGNFEGSRLDPPDLTIPDDQWTWSMIYIIEGADGEFAQVDERLKDAFIFLTYKNKPNFMWAISRVEYVYIDVPFTLVTDDNEQLLIDDDGAALVAKEE